MYTISKEFHFSASHQLMGLPADHPCSRVHGHNYVVTIELSSTKLNSNGFVVDYRMLEPIKKWIDDNWDHQHLNDRLSKNPTAENIARTLYYLFKAEFPQLSTVIVSETDKTSAMYSPEFDEHGKADN